MRLCWTSAVALGILTGVFISEIIAVDKEIPAEIAGSILEKEMKAGIYVEEEKSNTDKEAEAPQAEDILILQENSGAVLFTDEDIPEKDLEQIREVMKVEFALSKSKEAAEKYGIAFPGFYYKSEHGLYKYPLVGKGDALVQEINLLQGIASIPLFGEIKQENYLKYEGTGLVTAYLISDSNKINEFAWMEEVAEPLKEKIKIALLDFTSTKFFLESAGVKRDMTPSLLIIIEKDKKIYKYKSSLITEKEKAKEFMDAYLNGTLEPFLMDEKISEEEKENAFGVRKVSMSTFKKHAMDILTNSLIVYHVEWCKYCQSFLPELDKLSDAIRKAGISDIKFGKMLMSKNDLPLDVDIKQIQAYPSIRLYKKGTNEEVEYENGEKPADAPLVLEFLKKHCDIPDTFTLDGKKEETVPEVKQDL